MDLVVGTDRRPAGTPEPGLVRLTHLIYGLHTLALLTGILGSATVIGSFLGGFPSLAAVILNYVKRSDTRGTWVESHFRWQIRTFWFALIWVVVAVLVAITVIGLPVAFLLLAGLTMWVIYRIGRGWLALNAERPVPG